MSLRCGEVSTSCRRVQQPLILIPIHLRYVEDYSRCHLLYSFHLLPWPSSGCPVPRNKFLSASAILPLSHPSLRWASEHGTWISPMLLRQFLSRFRLDIDTWIAQQSTAMRKRWAMASRRAWRQSDWIDLVSGLHQNSGMISMLPFSCCMPSHCISKLTRCTVTVIAWIRSSKGSIRR